MTTQVVVSTKEQNKTIYIPSSYYTPQTPNLPSNTETPSTNQLHKPSLRRRFLWVNKSIPFESSSFLSFAVSQVKEKHVIHV